MHAKAKRLIELALISLYCIGLLLTILDRFVFRRFYVMLLWGTALSITNAALLLLWMLLADGVHSRAWERFPLRFFMAKSPVARWGWVIAIVLGPVASVAGYWTGLLPWPST